MTTRRLSIGFAGLGRMGRPMAGHLAAAGQLVSVYNRRTSVATEFAELHSVEVSTTPRELARRCDVIIAMVADGPALLDLLAGDSGLVECLEAGDVVIDMGTTGVDHTVAAREAVEARGAHLVEAPVSGSVASAEARSLLVMAAGDDAPVADVLQVLCALSNKVTHVGGRGAGAAMKLAVNSVLFSINEAIAEGLVLAERSGVDRSVAYDVFAASAVAAPVVHYRRDVFERPGETPVTFSIDLAAKDLDLILQLAQSVSATMPQAAINLGVMRDAQDAGLGNADMGDVARLLRGDES